MPCAGIGVDVDLPERGGERSRRPRSPRPPVTRRCWNRRTISASTIGTVASPITAAAPDGRPIAARPGGCGERDDHGHAGFDPPERAVHHREEGERRDEHGDRHDGGRRLSARPLSHRGPSRPRRRSPAARPASRQAGRGAPASWRRSTPSRAPRPGRGCRRGSRRCARDAGQVIRCTTCTSTVARSGGGRRERGRRRRWRRVRQRDQREDGVDTACPARRPAGRARDAPRARDQRRGVVDGPLECRGLRPGIDPGVEQQPGGGGGRGGLGPHHQLAASRGRPPVDDAHRVAVPIPLVMMSRWSPTAPNTFVARASGSFRRTANGSSTGRIRGSTTTPVDAADAALPGRRETERVDAGDAQRADGHVRRARAQRMSRLTTCGGSVRRGRRAAPPPRGPVYDDGAAAGPPLHSSAPGAVPRTCHVHRPTGRRCSTMLRLDPPLER